MAYRSGSRDRLDQGAADRAILAGRAGRAGVLRADGELQAGAYGLAVPLAVGPEASAPVEASVGVVSLGPLDVRSVGPSLERAAQALRALLR